MKDEFSTMQQKARKTDINTNKNGKHSTGKIHRKSLLGSSTLAVFLQTTQHVNNNNDNSNIGEHKNQKEETTAIGLFTLLKNANKVIVKGAKLYESLNELKLCGWINPHTLLLNGPSEDLKVVKHAWVKRHLKNPKGYFIKDIGLLKDCIVEMIPQSPFMSLTTALFDAVADLNHQNVYPTKDTLYEYLRKRYPDIKTPETKAIHECLGRLIKNRRLYHNGRGYFILMNENVLNEVIALNQQSSTNRQYSDCSSYEPSILGFSVNNESRTSSSGQTDGHTDFDKYSVNDCDISVTDVSISDFPSVVVTQKTVPELPTQKTLGSRFFRRNNSKSDKYSKKPSSKNRVFSCGLGGTPTVSIILSNGILDSPLKLSSMDKRNKGQEQVMSYNTIKNEDVADSVFSDDTLCDESIHFHDTQKEVVSVSASSTATNNTNRRRVKRSKSFSGKSNKAKSQKEVSFALVGAPNLTEKNWSSDSEIESASSYFKQRSFSFGVGYSRNIHQRPQIATVKSINRTAAVTDYSHGNSTSIPDENLDRSLDLDDYDIYRDLQSSFVDDSVPLYDPEDLHPENLPRPDILPIDNSQISLDMLNNYKDLGSALSLPAGDRGNNHFTVLDLLSPTREESLAEELKDVYESKPLAVKSEIQPAPKETDDDDLSSIDVKLLSPRSRRKLGTPYESQYITEALKESEQVCKALEESKKDNNSNYVPDKANDKRINSGNSSSKKKTVATTNTSKDGGSSHDKKLSSAVESGGVKLRLRSKSTEDRKTKQKERNSQLFEEKRSSLKVIVNDNSQSVEGGHRRTYDDVRGRGKSN